MQDPKIFCDNCEMDITYKGNSVEYRLVLKPESKQTDPENGMVTDMMLYPCITKPAHFCGGECLKEWANKKF